MQGDAREIARRSFIGAGIGGLGGAVLGGGLGAWLFPEPRNARPPIIIKGSSLEVWAVGGGMGLVQQGTTATYFVGGSGEPLEVELVGFSDPVPDEDWDGIGSLEFSFHGGGKLTVKTNRSERRVEYLFNKVLTKEGKKYKHPDAPKVKEISGYYPNGKIAFGPIRNGDLKFSMELR